MPNEEQMYRKNADNSYSQFIELTGSNAPLANVLLADAKAVPNTSIFADVPMLYNGATLDFQRGNTQGTLLASAARTTSVSAAKQTNHNAKGVMIFLRVSVASGTGGLKVKITGYDPVNNQNLDLNIDPTAITVAGWYIYTVYPGATAVAGTGNFIAQSTSIVLPRDWSAGVVANLDSSSYTYSLGYSLIL